MTGRGYRQDCRYIYHPIPRIQIVYDAVESGFFYPEDVLCLCQSASGPNCVEGLGKDEKPYTSVIRVAVHYNVLNKWSHFILR